MKLSGERTTRFPTENGNQTRRGSNNEKKKKRKKKNNIIYLQLLSKKNGNRGTTLERGAKHIMSYMGGWVVEG